MKVENSSGNGCKTIKHLISFVVTSILPFCLAVHGQTVKNSSPKNQDVPLSGNLRLKLAANNNPLHLNYPLQVLRLYRQAKKNLLWLAPDTVKMHAADAMMLLDCVLQYGLNHDDYHPKELQYDKLKLYTSNFSKTSFIEKSRFDRLLTDAMLTFMNDLHYGKLNPEHRPWQIDATGFTGFSAGTELLKALRCGDFNGVITGVQPQSKAYTNLQYRMHLLEGRMTAECYSFPKSEIKKMAINMERLRWVDKNERTFIQINIPSFTLKFFTPDSTYVFKVIVGAPASPTPVKQDALSYFTTQPDGLTSRLIFRSDTHPAMSIKGVNDRQAFSKQNRATSPGYIAIEQPEKLVALLLRYGGAKSKTARLNQTLVSGTIQIYKLTISIPVIVTYLTLEINDGIIYSYNDIYQKDNNLEMALYNHQLPLIQKK